MTNGISRRSLLAGSAAALSVAALGRPLSAAETELRLMWWGSKSRADRTFALIDAYQTARGGAVAIAGESVPWSDYWTRLATQVAGRNAPDILQMDYRYIFEYARRGALADLSQFRDGTLPLEGFSEEALEGGSVDGQLYGVSLGANSSAIMVNTAAFETAGLPLPGHDLTYDSYKELCLALTEANEGMHGCEDSSGYDTVFENWLRQDGKALFTADGQLGFTAADVGEWYALWAGFRESGACVTPELQALDQRQIENSMISLGHAAMAIAHTNQYLGYQGVNPNPLAMATLPRRGPDGKGGHYRKPSMFFSVSAAAEAPETCADFLNYTVTDPEAAVILDVDRGVPESPAMQEVLLESLDEGGRASVEFIADLGDLAGPLPPPPPKGAGEFQTAMIANAQQVAFGYISIEQGAQLLVDEANSILSRA